MKKEIKQRIEQIRWGEVPEGYKKTVAGIIPSEWELHLLSDHLQESRIPGSNGSMAKKLTVKLWNKGVLEKREIHEGSESTTYYSRKSGQLIYSKLDFLNCAFGIIPDHLDGYESTQDLPCFDIDGVNPYYLLTYMTQRSFYSHYGMIADGGRKARRVNPEDMLSFPLIYPSILEQEKIAKVLETQDRVITLYEKKVEQLKKLKKVFLQKMFPKTGESVPDWRFLGFTDAWEQRKFSDFTWNAGERNSKNLVLEPYAVTNDRGFIRQIDAHDEFGYMKDVDRKAYNIVKPNSFAYNPARINVGSIGYYDGSANVIVSSLYEVFQTTELVDDRFLWYWFKSDLFSRWIQRLQEGSVRMYFYYDKLCECIIRLPAIDEQKKIAAILDNLDRLITIHQRKCDEEKQKKKALMQLLLTGIVRL